MDRTRVIGLDVARCLALLGMIATHVLPGFDAVGGVPVVQQIAGGRASALFAVLAGASLALMSGGPEPVTGRDRAGTSAGLAVRALMVAFLGLLLADPPSGIAIILTYYGLLFLLGIPFLGLRAPALFALGGAWLVVAPVVSHLVRPSLPERGFESPDLGSLAEPVALLSELTFTGYYPVFPWLAYLLIGMGVGRLDLSNAATAARTALAGLALALLSWAGSGLLVARPGVLDTLEATYVGPLLGRPIETILEHGLFGSTPTGSWWWLAVRTPHTATPFDLAHTIGCALLVIGACVLAARFAPQAWRVVFGAGAMTLTLYSLHVLMRTPGVFPGDDLTTYLTHVGVVLGIGALYAALRARGPLESLVRSASTGVRRAVSGRADPARR